MKLTDWLKRRLVYGQRAQERDIERASIGAAMDEDIPYYAKAHEEVMMDLLDRLEKIEHLYEPMPETQQGEKRPELKFMPAVE